MPAFHTKAVLPLLLSVTVTAVAGAQQSSCAIDENKFARVVFNLQRARSAKTSDEAGKSLKPIVAELTAKTENPAERNYLLAQALVEWFKYMPTAKRGELGFTASPEATVDVAAAIDTAFSAVEKAKPECVATIAQARRNEAWAKSINGAVEAINADKVDSAEVLAKRSLQLMKSAYAYNVLGNVAQKRGNTRQAVGYYKELVKAAEGDTAQAETRRQVLLVIGNVATEASRDAQGADKQAYLSDARWAYETLKNEKGGADLAQQGLARVAVMSGDTASLKQTYQAQLANPSAYSYSQLMNAAVAASQANQTADATRLFEAAYQQNPYHRDVLFNLAIMYIKQDTLASKALPFVQRLIETDPSNGENYRLFTFIYAAQQKRLSEASKALAARNREYGKKANATANARLKKAYIDSAGLTSPTSPRARVLNDSVRVITDLALRYNSLADSLPVKVTFTEFTPTAEKTTLAGTVTNNSQASQTYALTVEFLDKSGKVIATQQTSVGPVAAGQSSKFSVSTPTAGAAAFRYQPLSKVSIK